MVDFPEPDDPTIAITRVLRQHHALANVKLTSLPVPGCIVSDKPLKIGN